MGLNTLENRTAILREKRCFEGQQTEHFHVFHCWLEISLILVPKS